MFLALLLVLDVIRVGSFSPADSVFLLLLCKDGQCFGLFVFVLCGPAKESLICGSPGYDYWYLSPPVFSSRGDPLAKAGSLVRRHDKGNGSMALQVLKGLVVHKALLELGLFEFAVQLDVELQAIAGGDNPPLGGYVPVASGRVKNCHMFMIPND